MRCRRSIVNCKVVPLHGIKEVEIHAPAALFPLKGTRYPLNVRLGGPQSRSTGCGVEKISCSCWESNNDSSVVQPVAKPAYRLKSPAPTFNLLATDFFFQILAHPVFKM